MYVCTSYAPSYDLPACASTANAACVPASVCSQVSSSKSQFRLARPAGTALTPSPVNMPQLPWRDRGAQLELVPALLYSWGLPGCRGCAASGVWASSRRPSRVYRSCSHNRSCYVAGPLNTDYRKKLIFHLSLFIPYHSSIFAFFLCKQYLPFCLNQWFQLGSVDYF